MREPRWNFELLDLGAGGEPVSAGRLRAFQPVITYAIGKAPTVTLRVRDEDPLQSRIDEFRSRVKAYRVPAWVPVPGQPEPDGVLRAYNIVATARDVLGDDGGTEIATVGAWNLLARRTRQDASVYAGLGGSSGVFSAVDQGAIIKTLIDDENRRQNTYIRTSAYSAVTGTTRTVTVPRDKPIAQQILDIANSFGGVEIECVPVDNEPLVMADLRVHYPQQGVENLGVFFEHGLGKRNVLNGERIRDTEKLSTDTHVLGRADGATQRRADLVNADMRAHYHAILDTVDSYSDIENQAIVDAIADMLSGFRAAPRELLTLQLAPTAGIRPFDDFNLGDTVSARIVQGRVNIDGAVRIWGFQITPTETGEERLSSITIEPEG